MPLAYSYQRFSHANQRTGDSLRRQQAAYDKAVSDYKLTPATTYHDESRSGWSTNNKQRDLARFVALVQEGKIESGSFLIVESLDRLSRRRFKDTYKMLTIILEAGITVITTSPESKLTESSLDEMHDVIKMALICERAWEESKTKSDRIKPAWKNKLQQAHKTKLSTRGPSWLSLEKYGKQSYGDWYLIPDRVKVVEYIFKLNTVNGFGARAIAKQLNMTGVAPFKVAKNSGKLWHWSYVRLILGDRRVIGELKTKLGDVIPNYYPAIIDTDTFLKAQANTIKQKNFKGKTDKISNLFSGIAFHKESGASMVYVTKGKGNSPRWIPSVYQTSTSKGKSFNYPIWEAAFLKFTKELTLNEIGSATNISDKQIKNIEGDIAKLDIQADKINSELSSLNIDPAIGIKSLTAISAKRKLLQIELGELQAQQHATKPKDALIDSCSIIDKLAKAVDDELIDLRSQLRNSIRSLISRIEVEIGRTGGQTHLLATVMFHSGNVRKLLVITTMGGATLSVSLDNSDKINPLIAEISEKMENQDEVITMLDKFGAKLIG